MKKSLILISVLLFLILVATSYSVEISDLRPVGGEVYQNSATYTILWDYSDTTGTIDLKLWNGDNASWSTIATNRDGTDESYDWLVDEDLGSRYRIKAVSSQGSSSYTMSLGYFTISNPPQQATVVDDDKQEIATTLKLYPNPANQIVNFEIDNESIDEIFIWDANGTLFRRFIKINSHAFSFNTAICPIGLYYVECIMQSGKRITSKLVVIR